MNNLAYRLRHVEDFFQFQSAIDIPEETTTAEQDFQIQHCFGVILGYLVFFTILFVLAWKVFRIIDFLD